MMKETKATIEQSDGSRPRGHLPPLRGEELPSNGADQQQAMDESYPQSPSTTGDSRQNNRATHTTNNETTEQQSSSDSPPPIIGQSQRAERQSNPTDEEATEQSVAPPRKQAQRAEAERPSNRRRIEEEDARIKQSLIEENERVLELISRTQIPRRESTANNYNYTDVNNKQTNESMSELISKTQRLDDKSDNGNKQRSNAAVPSNESLSELISRTQIPKRDTSTTNYTDISKKRSNTSVPSNESMSDLISRTQIPKRDTSTNYTDVSKKRSNTAVPLQTVQAVEEDGNNERMSQLISRTQGGGIDNNMNDVSKKSNTSDSPTDQALIGGEGFERILLDNNHNDDDGRTRQRPEQIVVATPGAAVARQVSEITYDHLSLFRGPMYPSGSACFTVRDQEEGEGESAAQQQEEEEVVELFDDPLPPKQDLATARSPSPPPAQPREPQHPSRPGAHPVRGPGYSDSSISLDLHQQEQSPRCPAQEQSPRCPPVNSTTCESSASNFTDTGDPSSLLMDMALSAELVAASQVADEEERIDAIREEIREELKRSFTYISEPEDVFQAELMSALPFDAIAKEEKKKKKKRKSAIYVCVAFLFALALALGLGIGLGKRDSSNDNNTQSSTTTPAPNALPHGDDNISNSGAMISDMRSTLEIVRERGYVKCGTNDFAFGNQYDEFGELHGLFAEQCKAVALLALGDATKYEIVHVLWTNRFQFLANGTVDVLTEASTFNMGRDIQEPTSRSGLSFSTPWFYSGLAFGGISAYVDCAEKLDTFHGICRSLTVCTITGSAHVEILLEILGGTTVKLVSDIGKVNNALAEGECNAVAAEPAVLATLEHDFGEDWKLGTSLLSKDPLSIVTRDDDPAWTALVDLFVDGLILAESLGITKENSNQMAELFIDQEESELSEILTSLVAHFGNSGDLYLNEVEATLPRSTSNSVYGNGHFSTGLMYSIPFGELQEEGPGPLPDGKLDTILRRGYLICGVQPWKGEGFANMEVLQNETADEIDLNGIWSGFDVQFCRGVAAALFAGEERVLFVEMQDMVDSYAALKDDVVDLVAGARVSLQAMHHEPTTGQQYKFSTPYYFDVDEHNHAHAFMTSVTDVQFNDFVNWIVQGVVYAEEEGITSLTSTEMPVVNLYGNGMLQMFRDCIFVMGSLGELWNNTLQAYIPRTGANQLNVGLEGPQLYPIPAV